jgi:hypothetical protein
MRTTNVKRSVWWAFPVVLALGCAAPGDDVPEATGLTAGGDPAVQIDTNRRLVMETTSTPRGGSSSGSSASGDISTQQLAVTDSSGTITTQVFLCATGTPAAHNVLRCTVGPSMVVVGGGAWAKWSGAGGLLTASYPFDDALTTWEARSVDHGVSDPHLLYAYVIGMQLNGVSREVLRSHITRTVATAGPTAHPQVKVIGPANDMALGGGALIESSGGAGNLLVRSMPRRPCNVFPTCGEWWVAGSDHVYSDPGTITGYAITIKRNIANWGSLQVTSADVSSAVIPTGPQTVRFDIPDGYALTGLGAETSWSGAGRLLTRIGTADMLGGRQLIFEDKDHLLASSGSLIGYAQVVRRAP